MSIEKRQSEGGWDCALYLENGTLLEGIGFGAKKNSGGEIIFNTGMTGYQEIFTDPSYLKQIVTMTYPHLGNTGINPEDFESSSVYLDGVVAREYCDHPSNWRQTKSLHQFLAESGVPGISEIDTRHLTRILRDEGAQRAVIFPSEGLADKEAYGKELLGEVPPMEGLELVSQVSCKSEYIFPGSESGRLEIVVVDFGVKRNILKHLTRVGFKVRVVPYDSSYESILSSQPHAVMLSNGPGDPGSVEASVETIKQLIGKIPLMAICMGHQLLGRALGAETFKLKFGHHGVNHPVRDELNGQVLITSQNHGFCVDRKAIEKRDDVRVSHIHLNDQTLAGFYSDELKLLSVQFHPESGPGPSDANILFDTFFARFVH